MAKLIAGPWVKFDGLNLPANFERVDVCSAVNPRWLLGAPIKAYVGAEADWHFDSTGEVMADPKWFRRYTEAVHDSEVEDVSGHTRLDLEHLSDGSARLGLWSASQGTFGEITISPEHTAALADWLNKVVEANKQ